MVKTRYSFEGEDVIKGKVTDAKGQVVTDEDARVPCDQCSSYAYHYDEGCVPLGYDDRDTVAVCQAGFLSATGKWTVPYPKKC